jgi:hypothetical protein
MDDPVYLLDANVFIEASLRYYAFDIAPPFWENLIRYANDGLVQSIDMIKLEIDKGKGPLANWLNNEFDFAFMSTDDNDVISAYSDIMNWVDNQHRFIPAAKAEFANNADGWLIAFAKAKGCIVVTHEQPAPDSQKKVKIPDVCDAFNVVWTDTFKMLRALGFRFD